MNENFNGVRYQVLAEPDLTQDMRREIGGIIPPHWLPKDPDEARAVTERGWVQAEPFARVIASIGDAIVGQGSLVDATHPGGPVCLGLAEGFVTPPLHGRGIGRQLAQRRVAEAERRDADIIMTATVVPQVLSTLGKLGFRDSSPFEFFYSDPKQPEHLIYNQDWRVLIRDGVLLGPHTQVRRDF